VSLDLKQLGDELGAFLAEKAGLEIDDVPRQLWIRKAVEGDDCAPTYAVLVPYPGGPLKYVPAAVQPWQLAITGFDEAADTMASNLYNALLDAAGRPGRDIELDSFRIIAFSPRQPGIIGRDEKGRAKWVLNFDTEVIAA
jgi:hypothetical protein